jgi:hypothetical protein
MPLSLFKRRKPEPPKFTGPPEDPRWVKSPTTGKFTRLLRLDPEKSGLMGVSGVVVIWHAGVRPKWVSVGHADDLAGYLHQVGNNPEITRYEASGGLYVTWARLKDEYQEGVALFLEQQMKPLVPNPGLARSEAYPIPVLTPTQTQV